MNEYTIAGGDKGKERLDILSRTLNESTASFLDRSGIRQGMKCLDLGCGGGHVTRAIAARVGPAGQVLGLDFDGREIELATATTDRDTFGNISFAELDAYELNVEALYDLVYARFLMSHLSKPAIVLRKIFKALKPGGIFLAEDTDFSGHFSFPASTAFDTYISLYQELLAARGADSNVGPKLIALLGEAGFINITFQISQPVHLTGEGKRMAEITLEGISHALFKQQLVTPEEFETIQSDLITFRKRPNTLMSLPRIFQVSGLRSED